MCKTKWIQENNLLVNKQEESKNEGPEIDPLNVIFIN